MKIIFNFIVVVALGTSSVAHAWDNLVTGKVGRIEVHSPNSSSRNVTLTIAGETSMCTLPTNNDTAYIQKSATPDTYQIMLSVLLSAKATGDDVRLYINHGSEGCQVHRIDLI